MKGQGILFVRNIHQLEPIIHGGGQEYGVRSGTVNLPMNIAIVKAMKAAVNHTTELNHILNEFDVDLRQFLTGFHGVKLDCIFSKFSATHS